MDAMKEFAMQLLLLKMLCFLQVKMIMTGLVTEFISRRTTMLEH